MSAPTERTVLVERRIKATSQYCSTMCKHWNYYPAFSAVLCTLTDTPTVAVHAGNGKNRRTPACIDAEVAARGGAL